jgi:NTE family protein
MTSGAATETALILAGGLALGAYHAGAIGVLRRSGRLNIRAVAGTSIGAVTAAILAGNPPAAWEEKLDAFWQAAANDGGSIAASCGEQTADGLGRHLANWASVARSRLFGTPGLFRPRWPGEREPGQPFPSLYSLEPTRNLLSRLIDFDHLNSGVMRLCLTACDIKTGEIVTFDTLGGGKITLDHVLASGCLPPAFAPLVLGEQILVDGGFAANAPLEPFLSSARQNADWPIAILLDLFAAPADPPASLEASAALGTDLQFAMQTKMQLRQLVRERELEAKLERGPPGVDLLHLSYRPFPDEAGSEKPYDFSSATLADRIAAGERDGAALLHYFANWAGENCPGLRIHSIPPR